MKIKYYRLASIILFLLFLIFLVLYFFCNEDICIDFTSNLTTELFGILITIFLIELRINKSEEAEKKEKEKVMLRDLEKITKPLLTLFLEIYKASLSAEPDVKLKSFSQINNSQDFFSAVKHLDHTITHPSTNGQNWASYIFSTVITFRKDIDDFLDRHTSSLSSELLSTISDIQNSPFWELTILYCIQFPTKFPLVNNTRKESLFEFASMNVHFRKLITELVYIEEKIGTHASKEIPALWHPLCYPSYGIARRK